jgi:CRP-like cAMP-binding protein
MGRDILVTEHQAPMHREPSALERFVARLCLRSPLSKVEKEAILSLDGREVITEAHRDIVRPGQDVDFACLVVNGLVGRFDQLATGHRQITALHIPGDMCDLHSVPVPHTGWGIEALTVSRTLRIPHVHLRDLTIRFPAIASAFWRDTIVDASILAKWISALGRRSAKSRLAHLICELGMRMEQAGLGTRTRFHLPATQTQLADVLGLTPVHLNRTLQALRRDGALFTEGTEIRVPDLARVCGIAEFDPQYLLLESGAK